MKYEIETDGEKFTLEWQDQARTGTATINGQSVEFEVSEPELGIYTVFLDNQVLEVRVVGNSTQGSVDLLVQGLRLPLRVIDPRRRRRGSLAVSGKVELKATMPGRVVRWLCQSGDEIAAEQSVVVLEAMKMQNEVRSPKAGKVTELRVNPGQTVEAGVVLAVIE